MSKRNWIIALVFGLTLVASLKAQENEADPEIEPETTQEQPAIEPAPVEPAIPSPTNEASAEHDGGSAEHNYKKPQHDPYIVFGDGWAQWAMALLALVGVIISGWAVWLLKRTLNETVRAVSEGEKATSASLEAANAAREANQIMRDEQRAWVAVDFKADTSVSYQPNSNSVMLGIKFFPQNTGNTPAINMSIAGAMKVVPKGLKKGISSSDYTCLIKQVIRSAQESSIKGQMTETLFQGRPATLWQNGRFIHAPLSGVSDAAMESACLALCVAVCYKIPSGFGFAVCHGIVLKDGDKAIFSDLLKSAINEPVQIRVVWNPVSYT